MIQKLIIIILITLSFNCNSQTLKTIEKIELTHQNCLDKGEYMKGCSVEYYNQADSLLNVVYKKLKLKLSAEEQSKLKKEQLEWLKKRDKYFQKVYSEEKKSGDFNEGSNDFDMIIIDQKAEFVFERVKVLIKRT
ncbi:MULTISPECIES: lysozyme inhibitor LprI family protein [unclassified Flavobacterium]|uniref:lysozyme inhibitor LprI family protein n=1 Tax=unclassified Flavobacterium TaxID=196869 RepID=UPI00131D53AE|nr:lysozyme inhibitor LprI family protein [Flavobacterium sp. I-STPP5a]